MTIGISTSFENATSDRFLECQKGATLAIEEWNLKGGPLGLLVRSKIIQDSRMDTMEKENRSSPVVVMILGGDSGEESTKKISTLIKEIPVFCFGKSTVLPWESHPNLFNLSLDTNQSYFQDSGYSMFREKYQKRFMAKEMRPDAYLSYLAVNLTLNAIVSSVTMDKEVLLEEIRKIIHQNQGNHRETTHS